MNFLEALETATQVIKEQRNLDEIYIYETSSRLAVYLKDCEGSLQFASDEPLLPQIFLGGVVDNRIVKKQLSLEIIFSDKWEVRLLKTEHLSAIRAIDKTSDVFIDYTPVGKEVENV